jgi:hypothetical protein
MSSNNKRESFSTAVEKMKQDLVQLHVQTENQSEGPTEIVKSVEVIFNFAIDNNLRASEMLDEANEQLNRVGILLGKSDKQFSKNKRLLYFTAFLLFCVSLLWFTMLTGGIKFEYSKSQINKNISSLIENGADLDTISYALKNPQIDKRNILLSKNSYEDNVNLNDILKSIRLSYYTNKPTDDISLAKLEAIIIEHNEVDPFSKLQSYQKDLFSNVRFKADESYSNINEDINKIVQELDSKNTLVDEYLDKSTTSFWISTVGLIIALLTALFQIISAVRKNGSVSLKSLREESATTYSNINKVQTGTIDNKTSG